MYGPRSLDTVGPATPCGPAACNYYQPYPVTHWEFLVCGQGSSFSCGATAAPSPLFALIISHGLDPLANGSTTKLLHELLANYSKKKECLMIGCA